METFPLLPNLLAVDGEKKEEEEEYEVLMGVVGMCEFEWAPTASDASSVVICKGPSVLREVNGLINPAGKGAGVYACALA